MKVGINKILIICTITSSMLDAVWAQQNLVPNPSFEQMSNCPTVFGDFSVADWSSPTQGSPDYFNSCNITDASVPENVLGSQPAYGNGYVGIVVYDTMNAYSYREYVQVQLLETLNFGQKYWMSFYVSLADSSMYAIKEVGAYFSPIQINNNSMDTVLSFIPQVEFSDSILTSKNHWIKINGSFIANGNENYLIIGNFNKSQNTTATSVGNTSHYYSYYYIDNVCISNDSLTCNQTLMIDEFLLYAEYNIYPNPTIDYININKSFSSSYDLIILNSIGQQLYQEKNIAESSKTIDLTSFSKGMLFLTIHFENRTISYKLIKL